jgi:hypothetical protein
MIRSASALKNNAFVNVYRSHSTSNHHFLFSRCEISGWKVTGDLQSCSIPNFPMRDKLTLNASCLRCQSPKGILRGVGMESFGSRIRSFLSFCAAKFAAAFVGGPGRPAVDADASLT